jgi:hypothetical protein
MTFEEIIDELNQDISKLCAEISSFENAKTEDQRLGQVLFLEELLSPAGNEEFIVYIYRSLLSRDPDEGAMSWYCSCLARGEKNRIDLISELLASEEGAKIGRAVIGISDQGSVLSAVIKETAGFSRRIKSLEIDLLHIKHRVTAIPAAHGVFLKSINKYFDTLLSKHIANGEMSITTSALGK